MLNINEFLEASLEERFLVASRSRSGRPTCYLRQIKRRLTMFGDFLSLLKVICWC